jgi:hypothetical protein
MQASAHTSTINQKYKKEWQRRSSTSSYSSSSSELKASTAAGTGAHGEHQNRPLIASRLHSLTSRLIRSVRGRINEITLWRCAAMAFVTSLVIFHPQIDAGLVRLWTYLTTSSGIWATWFRHDRECVLEEKTINEQKE